MKKVARASNPGRCAYARCEQPGDTIFEHLGYRLLACSMAHALIAHKELEKLPPEVVEVVLDRQASQAEKLAAIKKFKKGVDY